MFNPDNRRCASCEHYATYPGVCCNTKSPYAADDREGIDSCDFWEERIEGKFGRQNGKSPQKRDKLAIERKCHDGERSN